MTDSTLANRIQQLERSNRRMRLAITTMACVLTLAVTMGAACHTYCELRAQRFVLVDEEGNQRATLGFDQGEPNLEMIGSSGSSQIRLGIVEAHDDSARLYLKNKHTGTSNDSFISVTATSVGGSSTIEFGGSHKRIRMNTNRPGRDARISISNEQGDTTATLP